MKPHVRMCAGRVGGGGRVCMCAGRVGGGGHVCMCAGRVGGGGHVCMCAGRVGGGGHVWGCVCTFLVSFGRGTMLCPIQSWPIRLRSKEKLPLPLTKHAPLIHHTCPDGHPPHALTCSPSTALVDVRCWDARHSSSISTPSRTYSTCGGGGGHKVSVCVDGGGGLGCVCGH